MFIALVVSLGVNTLSRADMSTALLGWFALEISTNISFDFPLLGRNSCN